MPRMWNRFCACLTAVDKCLAICAVVLCLGGLPRPAAGQTPPSITGTRDVFTGRPAAGGKAWATASLDSASWALGGHATLTVEVRHALSAGAAGGAGGAGGAGDAGGAGGWVFPAWADSLPGGLEIVRPLGGDTAAAAGPDGTEWIVVNRRFLVTAWDTGIAELPPLPVVFLGDTAWTAPVAYRIAGPDVTPDTPPMPPAELIEVRWTWWELLLRMWPYGAAAGALAALAWWLIKRYRSRADRPEAAEAPAAELLPHAAALAALERIQREAVWRMGDDKGHHAAISAVLRQYIEARWGFPALERTTLEIRRGLGALPLQEADRTLLLGVLDLADMVKFAKLRTGAEDHERAVLQALRFVHQTAPASPATVG